MSYRETVQCKRCQTTTVFTDPDERAVWSTRAGCPACYKQLQEADEDDAPALDREAPVGFEPRVTVNGVEVRVLSWEVITDAEGNDTGRRVIGVELP